MIKAIIVDCFGVLTKDPWREFYFSLPSDQQPEANDLNHAYDAGHLARTDFLAAVQQLCGRLPEIYAGKALDSIPKNHELIEYVGKLQVTYKTGLVSNIGNDWITREFLTAAEQAVFDAMIFSYAVGMTKPSPEIFQLAADRLSLDPSECVMIDDRSANVEGARSCGMQAIVYQNFGQARTDLEALL